MNRLSARERLMAAVVLGIVFLMVNTTLLSSLRQRRSRILSDLAARRMELVSLRSVAGERDLWSRRDAWLSKMQPKLENRDQAGVALLGEIKAAAKANNVQLENPELGAIESQPGYQSVSVLVQTKSSWATLVAFLNTLQQPGRFIVYEAANLQIDPADPSRMKGRFRIAKWYAP